MPYIHDTLRHLALSQKNNVNGINQAFVELIELLKPENEVEFNRWQRSLQKPAYIMAYIIYNCGKLAGHSRYPLPAQSLEKLVLQITSARDFTAQIAATLFTGLKELASTDKISDALHTTVLQPVIIKALDCMGLRSRDVSAILNGLVHINTEKKLIGSIEYDAVFLLEELLQFSQVDAQSIGMAILSLGFLAPYLSSPLPTTTLIAFLKRVQNLSEKNYNTIYLSSILQGLHLLSEANKLATPIDVAVIEPCLERLLLTPNLSPQTTSNCLLYLGHLVEAKNISGVLKTGLIESLYKHVVFSTHTTARNPAAMMHGLGYLASNGHMSAAVDSSAIHATLTNLPLKSDSSARSVSMIAFGLGNLAAAKKLTQNIAMDMNVFVPIIKADGESLPQNIAMFFSGFGKLAQAGLLTHALTNTNVQQLLDGFIASPELSTGQVAMVIHGLGLLAQAGKWTGNMEAGQLTAILQKLMHLPSMESRTLAMIGYGVGLLAHYNQLNGTVTVSDLLLSQMLACPKAELKHCSIYLHGLGLVAHSGQLEGYLDAYSAQQWLGQFLLQENNDPEEFSNILQALGYLAKANNLKGLFPVGFVHAVLQSIQHQPFHPKKTSILFQGIADLALEKHLDGSLDGHMVAFFLKEFGQYEEQFTELSLVLFLRSLGQLAMEDRLTGEFEARDVEIIISRTLQMNTEAVCESLYVAAHLKNAGKWVWPNDVVFTQQMSETLRFCLNKLILCPMTISEVKKALFAFTALMGHRAVDSSYASTINQLFDNIPSVSYLSLGDAITLLECLAAFKAHHTILDQNFHRTLQHINIPFTNLSVSLQEKIKHIIADLSSVPDWQNALNKSVRLNPEPVVLDEIIPAASSLEMESRPRPVAAPPGVLATSARIPKKNAVRPVPQRPQIWTVAYENEVFKAIADKNLRQLERLLGVKPPISKALVSSARQPLFNDVIRLRDVNAPNEQDEQQTAANAITRHFLLQTPAEALKILIAQAEHDYFDRLLRACSHHERYQLAIDKALHPILIHLSPRHIGQMITSLLNLELYRDHTALLQIVDALSVRRLTETGNQRVIADFQNQFLQRAIDFHTKTNHHKVVTRLLAEQRRLAANSPVLVDYEEDRFRLRPQTRVATPPLASTNVDTSRELVRKTSRLQRTGLPRDAVNSTSFFRVAAAPLQVDVLRANAIEHVNITTSSSFFPAVAAPILPALFDSNGSLMTMRQRPDLSAEYTTEDVEAILRIRINSFQEPTLILLGAVTLSDDLALDLQSNAITTALSHYLAHQESNLLEQDIILPIHRQHHWVAVRIHVSESQVPIITYYDSLPNAARQQQVMPVVNAAVTALFAATPTLRSLPYSLQQKDAVSCGAYMIENIYCDLKSRSNSHGWWDNNEPDLAFQIRLRHLYLLKQQRPDYYARQLQAAKATITVKRKNTEDETSTAPHKFARQGGL